jgi:hypothetical protein
MTCAGSRGHSPGQGQELCPIGAQDVVVLKSAASLRPGKPVENAYIESFNGKFRDECLNEHWFVNMAHARRVIENWRIEYNTERPHSSLDDRTPVEADAPTDHL